ncbi:MAG: ATP-grasp domain-containing protein [Planctomycetales bacterium]|nr:ATP-grasp domain-containing protein [Planctomycetales bacterium]
MNTEKLQRDPAGVAETTGDHCGAILIAGASVRAAVQSAVRGVGLDLVAADLYVDRDLAELATAVPLAENYVDLIDRVRQLKDIFPRLSHWLYTGGLENYPDLVDGVSRSLKLFGNCGDTLRAVRDPWRFAESVRAAGFCVPEMVADGSRVPVDGTWLRKRSASAGGLGVTVWDDVAKRRYLTELAVSNSGGGAGRVVLVDDRDVTCYWQRRVRGESLGGAFVASDGEARLLGVTRQLQADVAGRQGGMLYAGSIGPLMLGSSDIAQWQVLGERLAGDFGLQGVFGVDAICERGRLWPLEVNPRFTASLEILERAFGWNAVRLHVAACRDGELPDLQLLDGPPRIFAAKRIVYSSRKFTVDGSFGDWMQRQPGFAIGAAGEFFEADKWPSLADLPKVGTLIPAGAPVLTCFAQRSSELAESVDETLEALACEVDLRASDILRRIP